MSELKICRICLRTEAKMFTMNVYNLQCYYEDILNHKLDNKDILPKYFCYECATLLHKFHTFREKCFTGQKILECKLLEGPITYESIYMVDRIKLKLISTLDMIQNNKVNTFFTAVYKEFLPEDESKEGPLASHKSEAEVNGNEIKTEAHPSSLQEKDVCKTEAFYDMEIDFDDPLPEEVSFVDFDSNDSNTPDLTDENKVLLALNKPTEVFVSAGNNEDISVEENANKRKTSRKYADNSKDITVKKFKANKHKKLKALKKPTDVLIVAEEYIKDNTIKSIIANENKKSKASKNSTDVYADTILCKSNTAKKLKSNGNKKVKTAMDTTDLLIVASDTKDVTVKKLRPRRLKESNLNPLKRKSKPYKVASKLEKIIKEGNWKAEIMSEEEALQTFRAKSQCKKYLTALYKCTDCFLSFSNNDIYSRHRARSHNESLKLECRFCKMRFNRMNEIKRHMAYHYNKFQCLRCDLVCSRDSTVFVHDDFHKGGLKKCKHCNEEFRHMSTYYSHMRTTHRSSYLCNLCGRSFVSEAGLCMHQVITHLKKLSPDKKAPFDDRKTIETYCFECDIRFETAAAYDQHILQSSKHASNNKVNPKRDRKPVLCLQCGKEFPSKVSCLRHHRLEHPAQRFSQPQPTKHDAKRVCELCGALVLYGSFSAHMNKHTKINACSCELCGKTFTTVSAMKIHAVVHTGEKPFKCPMCDKRFTQSGSMKLHYRTFHLKEPYPKRNRKPKLPLDAQDYEPDDNLCLQTLARKK